MDKFLIWVLTGAMLGVVVVATEAKPEVRYRSHVDSFGNTTIYGSDGSEIRESVDSFGNTDIRVRRPDGSNGRCTKNLDSFGGSETTCRD